MNYVIKINSTLTYTEIHTTAVVQRGGGWTPPPPPPPPPRGKRGGVGPPPPPPPLLQFLKCCSILKRFYLQWKAFDLLNKIRYIGAARGL